MEAQANRLHTLLVQRPTETTPVVLAPKLEILPTQAMKWENFELLLRRLAQEVRGLRNVRVYGERGQKQFGIDICGLDVSGAVEAVQTKKYQKFTKADLKAAVKKFHDEKLGLPFTVTKLFIAAACDADRTEITDELYELNKQQTDLEIDLWDRRTICDLLRSRRDIVEEFFGAEAADRFCLAAPPHVVAAALSDKANLAAAVMRGPAEATGADECLALAVEAEQDDPAAAARHVLQAETLLIAGGFDAHASVLTRRRADLLSRAGDHEAAARLLSDAFWQALDSHDLSEVSTLTRLLTKTCESAGQPLLADVAGAALRVLQHPLTLPDIDLAVVAGQPDRTEVARLLLLMAQTAATERERSWVRDNAERMSICADAIEAAHALDKKISALAYRLRIEVADATGEWSALVAAARRRRVPTSTGALILARYGLHHAERGAFDEADGSWAEATEQACLDGDNHTAAEWVHSRRILHSRHRGLTSDLDDFPRLVRSLRAMPAGQNGRTAERVEGRARQAIVDDKPHVAAPLLRAYLRMAHSSGSWGRLDEARELLAGVYEQAEEFGRSVDLLVLAGQAKKAAKVAENAGDRYLDVRDHLGSPAYWVHATAFRVLAEQADLVPDEQVDGIVESALDVLRRARTGTLIDTPLFGPSLETEALRVLANLSGRLATAHARELLDYLQPLVPREANTYRFSDDHHVGICVGIATASVALRGRALGQLLDLLAHHTSGVSQKVEAEAQELFIFHARLVRERLSRLAAEKNPFAASLLSLITDEVDDERMSDARAAADRLTAPLRNSAGVVGQGTGAVRDAHLATLLPETERGILVRTQLDRAASPYEPGGNRADYYLAASVLSEGLEDIDDLFETAMQRSFKPGTNQADLLTNLGNHPLSTFRTKGFISDTRPHALTLAAALARTPGQKARVRDQAVVLLGSGDRAGWYAVHALRKAAPDDLVRDVPLLAVHHDWAARSLAAITWANSSPSDATVGLLLASDLDQRVRRSLAEGLRDARTTVATEQVRKALAADSRHSVRSLLLRAQFADED